jgi:hypothetical protein
MLATTLTVLDHLNYSLFFNWLYAAMKFKATEAFVEIKLCKMAALMSFFCGNPRRLSRLPFFRT